MSATHVFLASTLFLAAATCSLRCGAAEPAGDTIVFVGELISIEGKPDPCEQRQAEKDASDCISVDAFYTEERGQVYLPPTEAAYPRTVMASGASFRVTPKPQGRVHFHVARDEEERENGSLQSGPFRE